MASALSRLAGVLDPTRAYHSSSDHAKAIMRANMQTVMPRLTRLWATINEPTEVAS